MREKERDKWRKREKERERVWEGEGKRHMKNIIKKSERRVQI